MMPRGRTAKPPFGNIAKAAVRSSGVTSPVPSDSDGTSGRSSSPASEASLRTGRDPRRCCNAVAARLFDSMSAARSVSASGVSPRALRGAHSSGPCGRMFASPSRTVTGENPWSSAAAYSSGLNADPGCRRLRVARLNCDSRKSRAADEREDVAVARIDRDERRLKLRVAEPPQALGDRAFGRLLQLAARTSSARPSRADGRRRTDRGTAGAGTPWRSRRADRSRRGTGRCGSAWPSPRAPAPR